VGDPNRNAVFAAWVRRTFAHARSALVVADGNCLLAHHLARKTRPMRVRVVEARLRSTTMRKGVLYEHGWFTPDSPVREDVVLGMHPDDATAAIILAAEAAGTSWAVVPCCVRGPESHGIGSYEHWLNRLESLAPDVQRSSLAMGGRCVVLWRRRPRA
jgi:hypothetical protein